MAGPRPDCWRRASFDGVFIADVIGYYDVYKAATITRAPAGGADPGQRSAATGGPASRSSTEHLGFGITASTSFEHPYTFARRISTLDHHTKGRIGWNIVTSYLESGARNVG